MMEDVHVSYRVMDFGPLVLLGKKTIVQQGKTATKFVKSFRTDGSNAYLQSLDERVSPMGDVIIWMGEYDGVQKTFVEIPGVFVKPGTQAPEGFAARELPACTMAVCTISGRTRSLSRGAHNKLVKLMAADGYAPDYSYGYSMEYYSYENYEKNNELYQFSYYLPCKKK